VVAAFIAGVQAQIISFTLPLPRTTIGRVANFFAFLGLILDIIGTYFGVLQVIYLQQGINDDLIVLSTITIIKNDANFAELVSNADPVRVSHSEGPGLDGNGYTERRKKMLEFVQIMQRRFSMPRDSGIPLMFQQSPAVTLPVKCADFGEIPLGSMGLGVICLIIATVLLSAQVLAKEVWISCTSVLVGVGILSNLPALMREFREARVLGLRRYLQNDRQAHLARVVAGEFTGNNPTSSQALSRAQHSHPV